MMKKVRLFRNLLNLGSPQQIIHPEIEFIADLENNHHLPDSVDGLFKARHL
jgi:hypothetical protein